jgi:hypothetical protein
VSANKNGTKHLVLTLNRALGERGLSEARIERGYETWWPELERTLAQVPAPGISTGPEAAASVIAALQQEIAGLRGDFVRQAEYVRSIVSSITARPAPTIEVANVDSIDLTQMEGVWRDRDQRGIYCARLISGAVRIAYSFSGSAELTGELYNVHVVGDVMLGRFRWFGAPVSGYAYLRLESNDVVTGGWWYAHDVPADIVRDYTKLDASVPGMIPWSWTREDVGQGTPKWAEKFFAKLSRDAGSGPTRG